MFQMEQNLTLAIPNMWTSKTSTSASKAIIWLQWPKMLIPLSTWFSSNDFNECNSRKLPITNLLSLTDSFSRTLKWTHSSHMDQKFISYLFFRVMLRSHVPFFEDLWFRFLLNWNSPVVLEYNLRIVGPILGELTWLYSVVNCACLLISLNTSHSSWRPSETTQDSWKISNVFSWSIFTFADDLVLNFNNQFILSCVNCVLQHVLFIPLTGRL